MILDSGAPVELLEFRRDVDSGGAAVTEKMQDSP
jgi:hypothetical protein